MNVRHALAGIATAMLLLGGTAACGSDSADDPGSGSTHMKDKMKDKMDDKKSPMDKMSQSPMHSESPMDKMSESPMHSESPMDDMSDN